VFPDEVYLRFTICGAPGCAPALPKQGYQTLEKPVKDAGAGTLVARQARFVAARLHAWMRVSD
jgi:hypothetical protein